MAETEVKKEAARKFVDFIFPILADFAILFGVPALIRQFTGKKPKPEDIEHLRKASDHLQQGQAEQAREEFKKITFPEFTLADEQTFMTDVLRAVRQGSCSKEDMAGLLEGLSTLSEEQRDRFRAAHVNEPDADIRSVQLAQLAQMEKDKFKVFLQGCGLFDATPLAKVQENIKNQVNMLDAAAKRQVTALQSDITASWNRARANLNPPPADPRATRSDKFARWLRGY